MRIEGGDPVFGAFHFLKSLRSVRLIRYPDLVQGNPGKVFGLWVSELGRFT